MGRACSSSNQRNVRGPQMPSLPDHITITYQEPERRPFIGVTGAFGGGSPDQRSIVAHLFVEHPTVPSIMTHTVDAAGRVNLRDGDGVKRSDITRSVVATLVMAPEVAVSLGEFLVKQGKQAIKDRGKNG